MKKYVTILFLFFFVANHAWAACSGTYPTYTAASVSQSDVSACMDVASSGATINIPAGSANWSSRLTVTKSGLTFNGAGYGSTTISGYGFLLGTSANDTTIKNIYFSGGGSQVIRVSSGTDYGGTPVTGFVISECRFSVVSAGVIQVFNGSRGLIANNKFDCTGSAVSTVVYIYGRDATEWNTATFFGEAGQYVFFEDNLFTQVSGFMNHAVMSSWGASYVARCNKTIGGNDTWDVHGYGHGTSRHGGRLWELYGNRLDNQAQTRAIDIRGGSGRVFANRSNGAWSVNLTDYRMASYGLAMAYPITATNCAGSNSSSCASGSEATCCSDHEGYPCCGQVGWGGYGGTTENNNQSQNPAYFWDNKTDAGVDVTVSAAGGLPSNYIQLNRDYYVNSGSPIGYVPYTYPHPARGLSASYTCLSGANSEADTGIIFWSGEIVDTTAPTVSSVSIASNGETVTVNFSESVVTTGYDNGDFNLDCTTVGNDIALNSISGTGSTRTFSASIIIGSGDTCNLDYTGGTNEIEDASGNDLLTFSNTTVTNYSTQLTDNDPPEVSTAVIAADGLTVTITFNEVVVTTGYDAGDFNLDCNTAGQDIPLSSPSGSGISRTFTSATLVYQNDLCNLDYVGGADDITDTVGNDMETFSDTSVTSNSAVQFMRPVRGVTISSGAGIK